MTSSSMFPSSKWRSVAGRRRGSGNLHSPTTLYRIWIHLLLTGHDVLCIVGRFSIVREQGAGFDVEAVFDQEFINVKLSDYISKKYEILFFYPLDFTCIFPTSEFEVPHWMRTSVDLREVSDKCVGLVFLEITAFSYRHE